jgi:hypothetical protein
LSAASWVSDWQITGTSGASSLLVMALETGGEQRPGVCCVRTQAGNVVVQVLDLQTQDLALVGFDDHAVKATLGELAYQPAPGVSVAAYQVERLLPGAHLA